VDEIEALVVEVAAVERTGGLNTVPTTTGLVPTIEDAADDAVDAAAGVALVAAVEDMKKSFWNWNKPRGCS